MTSSWDTNSFVKTEQDDAVTSTLDDYDTTSDIRPSVKHCFVRVFLWRKHTAVSITCICMNKYKLLDTQQCVWLIFIQVQSCHTSHCKQAVISQWIWRFSLYVVRCLSHIPIPITFHRQFRPFWTDALYRVYRLLNWNPAPIPLNPPRSGPMTTSSEHLLWYIPF